MVRLLRKLLEKFVSTKVIATYKDITEVPYTNESCQLSDEYIDIGLKTREHFQNHIDDISFQTEKRFFRSVRDFYLAVVGKMLKKFPFNNDTLRNMGFLNPKMKENLDAGCVNKLLQWFPEITDEYITKLKDVFCDYQLSPLEQLTDKFENPETDIDEFLCDMGKQRDIFQDDLRFVHLCKLAKTLHVLPNSNADSERAFSMIRKIQTDTRSDLDISTICTLLSCKLNQDTVCYEYEPSDKLLKAEKSATMIYNKSHI